MLHVFAFFTGILAAGIVTGMWWLVLIGGCAALCMRFSYTLIAVAVVLDLLFLVTGESVVPFAYTIVFVVWALVCEWARSYIITR